MATNTYILDTLYNSNFCYDWRQSLFAKPNVLRTMCYNHTVDSVHIKCHRHDDNNTALSLNLRTTLKLVPVIFFFILPSILVSVN